MFTKTESGMWLIRPWLRLRLFGLFQIGDGIGNLIGWPWNLVGRFFSWEMEKSIELERADSRDAA